MRVGYKLANKMFNKDAINRVILCSDGVANTGSTNANTLVDFVRGYGERGVMLTTVGVGMGTYNDVLLEHSPVGAFDDDVYGKNLDVGQLRRLLRWMKPYRAQAILSLVLKAKEQELKQADQAFSREKFNQEIDLGKKNYELALEKFRGELLETFLDQTKKAKLEAIATGLGNQQLKQLKPRHSVRSILSVRNLPGVPASDCIVYGEKSSNTREVYLHLAIYIPEMVFRKR